MKATTLGALPNRYAQFKILPTPTSRDVWDSEEELTFWLWVWPGLLGWPRTVNWLFSPVTGRNRHPGDLWGLDSLGVLLVVETKIHRGRGLDPFEDFVGLTARARRFNPNPLGPEGLEARWKKLLKKETDFIGEYENRPDRGERRAEAYPGLIPYSSRRRALARWSGLYWEKVAPRLASATYSAAVTRSIGNRRKLKDPKTHFLGLISCTDASSSSLLSFRGERSLALLTAEVGPSRVFLRAATARPTNDRSGIRVHAWTPSISTLDSRP